MPTSTASHLCTACGWLYIPERGDPEGGVAPGVPWDALPDAWLCPACGADREDFRPVSSGAFPDT